jgi:hypothetical protein
VVDNKLFVSNNTSLLEMQLSPDFATSRTVKFRLVATFDTTQLRIFSLCGKLLIRDTQKAILYQLDATEQVERVKIDHEVLQDFNLVIATQRVLIGFLFSVNLVPHLGADARGSIMIYTENNQFTHYFHQGYKKPTFIVSNSAWDISDKDFELLVGESKQQYELKYQLQ